MMTNYDCHNSETNSNAESVDFLSRIYSREYHRQASAWFVTTVIFIVLFILMSGTSIYLCVLRQRRLRDIQVAHSIIQARKLRHRSRNIFNDNTYI